MDMDGEGDTEVWGSPEEDPLRAVVFFTDIRDADGEDTSSHFVRQLCQLGAQQDAALTNKVTHAILKEPSAATLKKIKARKAPLVCVNCLWVETCSTTQSLVDTKPFAVDPAALTPTKTTRTRKPQPVEQSFSKALDRQSRSSAGPKGSKSKSLSAEDTDIDATASSSPSAAAAAAVAGATPTPTATAIADSATAGKRLSLKSRRAARPSAAVLVTETEQFDDTEDDDESAGFVLDTPDRVSAEAASSVAASAMINTSTVENTQFPVSDYDDDAETPRRRSVTSITAQVERQPTRTADTSGAADADKPNTEQSGLVDANSPLTGARIHSDADGSVPAHAADIPPVPTTAPTPTTFQSNKSAATARATEFKTPTALRNISNSNSRATAKATSKKGKARAQPERRARDESTEDAAASEDTSSASAAKRVKTTKSRAAAQRASTTAKRDNTDERVFVLSSIPKSDRDSLVAAIKSLGGTVASEVTRATTHVISGGTRTMKVCTAIARGLWVVAPSLVLTSRAAGSWVAEEEHELEQLFPAAKLQRQLRESRGGKKAPFRSDILKGHSLHIVDRELAQEVRELVRLCGGSMTNLRETAGIVIAGMSPSDSKHSGTKPETSPKWIFDSVTLGQAQDIHPYLRVCDQGLAQVEF